MHVLTTKPLKVRVLSQNIRYAATSRFPGEEPWTERLPVLLSQLKYHTEHVPSTFICLQEVLHHQLTDIVSGLNSREGEWASIGVARDDGKRAGEYVPILYQPTSWKLEHYEHFWLSETPDRPSFGWKAGSKRIVTIGIFRSRDTSRLVAAMNTHLDNASSAARENGAKLILKAIQSYVTGTSKCGFGPLPVFLAGDMNSQEHQEAYKVFTSSESFIQDTKPLVPAIGVYGHKDTFTGFNGRGDGSAVGRLDYVFVSRGHWEAMGYATLPNVFDDAGAVRLSDHRAVVADIKLVATRQPE